MSEEKVYDLSARSDDRLSIGGKQLCIIIALASLLSGILGILSSFSIMIAQQAYTSLHLSRINYRVIGGINPIGTPKEIIGPHSQLILIRLENGKFALLADNGLYLSRINYGGDGGINLIEAAKQTIDPYSQFILIPLENGKFALQADNGLYLSRINCSNIDARNSGEAANKITDSCIPFAFPFPAPSRLLWNGHNPGN